MKQFVVYGDLTLTSLNLERVRNLCDLLGAPCFAALVIEMSDSELEPALQSVTCSNGLQIFENNRGVVDGTSALQAVLQQSIREMERTIAEGERATEEMAQLFETESVPGTAVDNPPWPKYDAGPVETRKLPDGFSICEICGDLFQSKRKNAMICSKDACKKERQRRYYAYRKNSQPGEPSQVDAPAAFDPHANEEKVYEVLSGEHAGEKVSSREMGIYLKIGRYEPGTVLMHKSRGYHVIMRNGKHAKVVRRKDVEVKRG